MKSRLIKSVSLLTLLVFLAVPYNSAVIQSSNFQKNNVWLFHRDFADLKQSVVRIEVDIVKKGDGQKGKDLEERAAGSGWILTDDGLIVTNFHVVGEATKIKVEFSDGTSTEAKMVGGDAEGDVAIIKVNTKHKLVPFSLGNSDQVKLGDQVIIMGNPLNMGLVMTHGIVADNHVEFSDFPFTYIQTDGTINPGNSGGVMLDSEGRVIGMVALLTPGENGGNSYGFAISVNDILWSIDQISKQTNLTRASLGIKIDDSTAFDKDSNLDVPNGVLVTDSLSKDFQKGDIITAINGLEVKSSDALHAILGKILVGDKVSFTIIRAGQTQIIEVVTKKLEFSSPPTISIFAPPPVAPQPPSQK